MMLFETTPEMNGLHTPTVTGLVAADVSAHPVPDFLSDPEDPPVFTFVTGSPVKVLHVTKRRLILSTAAGGMLGKRLECWTMRLATFQALAATGAGLIDTGPQIHLQAPVVGELTLGFHGSVDLSALVRHLMAHSNA